MTGPNVVLLLRAPSLGEPDPYQEACFEKGYAPLTLPVLKTTHVNLDELKRLVREGPGRHDLHGVVVTSRRSCEAWKIVVEQLMKGDEHSEGDAASWSSTPFYVVGGATASALLHFGEFHDSPYAPRDVRGAAESGTSEKLAHFILGDLPPERKGMKMLYLTGDKNKDTLPSILHDGGVELLSLQVYGTRGSTTFEDHLVESIFSYRVDSRWWIVYFAPSAAEFATPILRKYFHVPQIDGPAAVASGRAARVVAIGPTTANFLRDELKIRVDAVAKKPNAQDLVDAIDTLNES